MLGGSFKEAHEGKIVVGDDDPQITKALIYYLYFFDYEELTTRYKDVAPIVLDVKMHAIADKYFVEPLKQLATAKFEARAKQAWSMPAFAATVSEIYETSSKDDEPIKAVALETIRFHSDELLSKTGKSPSFLQVLCHTAELGGDLATSLPNRDRIKKYKCPNGNCRRTLQASSISSFRLQCSSCQYNIPNILAWWSTYEIKE